MRPRLNRFGAYRPRRTAWHFCPDTQEEVPVSQCVECPKWGVHEEGDVARCFYEYQDLKRAGFYVRSQEGWLDVLEGVDPETHRRLVQEKRDRERVLEEMEEEKKSRPEDNAPEKQGGSNEAQTNDDEDDDGWW